MTILRGHVEGGRVVIDEEGELPEGAQVEIAVLSDEDEMTPEERAELLASIDRGLVQAAPGRRDTRGRSPAALAFARTKVVIMPEVESQLATRRAWWRENQPAKSVTEMRWQIKVLCLESGCHPRNCPGGVMGLNMGLHAGPRNQSLTSMSSCVDQPAR
jgi:hypothetical protein